MLGDAASPAPRARATSYFADHAWLGGDVASDDVLIEVDGEAITSVRSGAARPPEAVHLSGVTLPGFANAHSHAFHRALRGRTQRGGGSFWTWREQMYAVADRLTPDSYYALARATYAEMALSGITCVGEFHYLHHGPGGVPYADANAMGAAVAAAAADAGIRITLLDSCYLTGGFSEPLAGPQLRFGDGDAQSWALRVDGLQPAAHLRVGAAIHSVRAVPAAQLSPVVQWARAKRAPLHVHLSEQRAENEASVTAYGCSPTQLLHDHDVLGPRSTAVHATHVDASDIALLGHTRTTICLCPTTERDLADGIGPARALADAGSPLALGSDSNAVVDLWEEARGLETHERLRSGTRGHWSAAALLRAAGVDGQACLGWPKAGRLALGAPADFVTLDTNSVRLAGADPITLLESVVFAATAADVREVVVAGRRVVTEGRHVMVEDVPTALSAAIAAVLS